MANDTSSEHKTSTNGAIASGIQSRAEFLALLRTLLDEFREKPEKWSNNTLILYLDALAAWVEDSDGYYLNQRRAVPDQPSWEMLADMFLAARLYE